ncbi:MAG: hypothetical protein ACTSV7_13445 [Candidatus Baldrarchaeia archaeon]
MKEGKISRDELLMLFVLCGYMAGVWGYPVYALLDWAMNEQEPLLIASCVVFSIVWFVLSLAIFCYAVEEYCS